MANRVNVELNRAHAAAGAFGGTIVSATNASPIVVGTSAAHNLAAGDQVQNSGVVGNLAANATAYVNPTDGTHFQMFSDPGLSVPIAGNGAYTSGGTVSMAYDISGITSFTLLRLRIESLTAGAKALVAVQDSADGFVNDIKTLMVVNPVGQTSLGDCQDHTIRPYQVPSARFGVANARLRVFVQSLDGGATVNTTLQFE